MTEPKKLHDDRLLTAKEIYTRLHISKSTFYKALGEGVIPKPYRFGARTNRWPESVLSDILRRTDDEVPGKQ